MAFEFGQISKAIAGTVAGIAGGLGTSAIVIPTGIEMPWYGYVLVALLNGVLGFAVVYFAPRNTPPA